MCSQKVLKKHLDESRESTESGIEIVGEGEKEVTLRDSRSNPRQPPKSIRPENEVES